MSARRVAAGRCLTSDERGVATLWAVGAIAALVALAALVFTVATATTARHEATGAADLSALAAAAYAPYGQPNACARARWVADRMGVRLTRCDLRGWIARVEVLADPGGMLAPFGATRAHARAGPAHG
jgi:secretion/DNA translocation related TadE-like protein